MDCQDQDQNPESGCCDKTSACPELPDVCEVTAQPLQSLKLASHAVLKEAQQRGRLKCSKCGGSRKFFCYTCCSLVGVTQEEIPLIKVCMKWVTILKFQLCWCWVYIMLLCFILHSASCEDRHHQASKWNWWEEHCNPCQDPCTQWCHYIHLPLHTWLWKGQGWFTNIFYYLVLLVP